MGSNQIRQQVSKVIFANIKNKADDKEREAYDWKEKMLAGKIYDPSNEELAEMRVKAHKLSQRYNFLYEDDNERKQLLMNWYRTKEKDYSYRDRFILTMEYLHHLEKLLCEF